MTAVASMLTEMLPAVALSVLTPGVGPRVQLPTVAMPWAFGDGGAAGDGAAAGRDSERDRDSRHRARWRWSPRRRAASHRRAVPHCLAVAPADGDRGRLGSAGPSCRRRTRPRAVPPQSARRLRCVAQGQGGSHSRLQKGARRPRTNTEAVSRSVSMSRKKANAPPRAQTRTTHGVADARRRAARARSKLAPRLDLRPLTL